jgi:hypothetical protein
MYVLILLYMCPDTGIYLPLYCHMCVLILLYMCPIYVSQVPPAVAKMPPDSACLVAYISALILLYVCPHTAGAACCGEDAS